MSSSQDKKLSGIVEPLLLWYRKNKRVLPWREDPSPYHVWISEIMLQQTRVEAVKSYYERFLKVLPDITSLAECPEDQLLKLWEGLGYYSRVRNMKKAANQILDEYDGIIPKDPKLLKKLSGIGDYTSGSIASIAYDVPVPAVDGNVLRVISRVLCSEEDISLPSVKAHITALLSEIEPVPGAGDFNQSLMELGATVCLPNGAPKCLCCPLAKLCLARQEGKEHELPKKAPKKSRKIEERTLFILSLSMQEKEYTLLQKRKSAGLLGGMWEFPALEENCSVQKAQHFADTLTQSLGLTLKNLSSLKPHKHIFTHIEWHMTAWKLEISCPDETITLRQLQKLLPENQLFVPCESLQQDCLSEAVALPSAFKPYRDILIK